MSSTDDRDHEGKNAQDQEEEELIRFLCINGMSMTHLTQTQWGSDPRESATGQIRAKIFIQDNQVLRAPTTEALTNAINTHQRPRAFIIVFWVQSSPSSH